MERKVRRIFFWVLVVFFFATASTIIPYALGVRYSKERGIFLYTGSITIKSNPRDIEVLVDGKPVKSKRMNRINNSYHIGSIRTGEHTLEIRAEGFNTWFKKVSVNSGKSTEFWNVILTKKKYEKESYSSPDIQNFFYDTEKKLSAYTKNRDGIFSVSILNMENGERIDDVFSSKEYSFTENEKENIEWEPRTKRIIIPLKKSDENNYFVTDIESGESLNLKEFSNTKDMRKVRWDPNDRNYIFYISEDSLYRIHTGNPEDKKTIAENVASYDISSGKVYYFQLSSGIVYSINPEIDEEPKQVTISSPEEMEDQSYQITVYDDKRIALLNKSGILYVYNHGEEEKYFRKLSDNTEEVQFSNDGKKMIFWNDWEIYAYFLREWDVQPIRIENEQKDITRFSNEIENVQWSKDYEHVIFSTDGKVKIIEIDHRDNRNLMDIVSLNTTNTKVAGDFPDDKLLFIDGIGENATINLITFPEDVGIF